MKSAATTGSGPGCARESSEARLGADGNSVLNPGPGSSAATCSRCKRGAEACGYCEGIGERDWETICDCGLYDFGGHLLDCEARAAFKYVVAGDYEQAKVPRV